MHEHAFAGNSVIPVTNCPELTSAAAMYGRGTFTTVAIYNGQPFLWEKHWRRLTRDASIVGVDHSPHDERTVRAALDRVVHANGVQNGRARISVFDASRGGVATDKRKRNSILLITTDDPRRIPDRLRLGISPFPVNSRSPLAGVKSCNYLENMLALEEARSREFDEALRVNERGQITSACMANIFWVQGKTIFTPSTATGCLSGTTREFLIEGIRVREVKATLTRLREAEAVFLTSAGLGILGVSDLEGRGLDHVPEEIADMIRGHLVTSGEMADLTCQL
jgi:branched-subunit amino acid aminotransferase/4-amino-4-deoxychorismate lyase